jgi:hypothetical protein
MATDASATSAADRGRHMASLQLAYRGLRIRVAGGDAAELAWLAEFLRPAFAPDDDGAADCEIVVRQDPARLAALRGAGARRGAPAVCLVLDTAPVSLPTYEQGEMRVVVHDEARLAYVVGAAGRQIEVVSAAADWRRREALMKLVRELAQSAAWSARSLVLHAATVAVGGEAILIAGPKRAGKTSLLLHLLGAAGAGILANDRVVLEHGDAAPVAHAMPTIVNLRADTVAARFADDASRRAAARHRFSFTVAEAEARSPVTKALPQPLACSQPQLAHLLGVELVGRAGAAALLLPRVDPEARGIELRRLSADEAAAQLPAVVFAAAQSPPRVSEVFALPSHTRPPSPAALQHLWRACAEQLRVFACRLGPDAYAGDPADVLSRIL